MDYMVKDVMLAVNEKWKKAGHNFCHSSFFSRFVQTWFSCDCGLLGHLQHEQKREG